MTGHAGRPSGATDRGSALWIDWGVHLRTHSLCQRLGIALVEIAPGGGRLGRYLKSISRTTAAIRAARPAVVYSTNPSIVLGYWLLLLRVYYRFRIVSDAHWAGVHPLRPSPLFQFALDFLNRRVDMVVVTNPGHEQFIRELGGNPFVCPDPLPDLSGASAGELELPGKSAFLICSFDHDEPFEAVFEAMESLQDEGFTLYVSGNYAKMGVDPARFPWVRFLGFVPKAEYYAHLMACDVAMDFTQLEDCLVCGAYEAMELGKPLVLSNSAALRSYFTAGSIFAANEAESIRAAVRQAYERRDQLAAAALEWARQNEVDMARTVAELHARALALR